MIVFTNSSVNIHSTRNRIEFSASKKLKKYLFKKKKCGACSFDFGKGAGSAELEKILKDQIKEQSDVRFPGTT